MNTNRTRSCEICFDQRRDRHYYHHHISTRHLNQISGRRYQQGGYPPTSCIICRSTHSWRSSNRNRLLITSSTLFGCWRHSTFRPTSCFEVESIIGGTYVDGKRAFSRSYSVDPRPLDILVVMGINNISKGQSLAEIANEIYDLTQEIRNHSRRYDHMIKNRICFATCIQPPKFMAFNHKNPPLHIKTNGNHHFRIKQLNRLINRINNYNGITGFQLHNEGTFWYKGRRYHNGYDWRENTWDKRLHFTPQVKARIGMRLSLIHI